MSVEKNTQGMEGQENFGLPQGYFQRSAANIMNRIEWEEEHQAYPSLLELKDLHGFAIPDGYFKTSEIHLELSEFETLARLPKASAFKVPAQYFELAEVNEFETVFVEETRELESFGRLSKVQRQNSFTTPKEYFGLNEKLLYSLLEFRRGARIVDLFFSRGSYVAAALLVMALGLWYYMSYIKPVQVQDCGTIACVDKSEVLSSHSMETLEEDDLFELVNPSELEESILQGEKNYSSDSALKQDRALPANDL